jgi:hypothetical protein
MSEKVVIPREVAEAIESERRLGAKNDGLLRLIAQDDPIHYERNSRLLMEFAGKNPETYARAIINGYTVEKTPEEKVREYFRSHETCTPELVDRYIGICKGVVDTLNLLGIKIEGVNA